MRRHGVGVVLGIVWMLVVAATMPVLAMGAAAPSPSPTGPVPSGGVNLTGHWAIAGTSGIDLVQQGTALRGSSVAGIAVSGTVDGLRVTFRWWRGASYASAKAADRGSGVMRVSPDGERLQIAAKGDDAGPGPFPTQMDAIRVHSITGPTATPWDYYGGSWWYGQDPIQVYRVSRAYLDYLVESWVICLQTGYWPSPAVAWIKVEDAYTRAGILLVGGWLPNGGGPTLLNPTYRRP
jgi:hypothetical protein